VTVLPASVVGTLVSVKFGPTYSETSPLSGNTGEHEHTGPSDGGFIPASEFSQEEVDNLQTVDIPVSGDAKKFLRVSSDFEDGYTLFNLLGAANQLIGANSAGTEIEFKTIAGTEKQVVVEHTAGTITLSAPQDLDWDAVPTFAGVILTALTGILETKGVAASVAIAANAALQYLRRNVTDDAYEFGIPDLKHISDVADAVTDSGASGDVMVRGASVYDRLVVGDVGEALIVDTGPIVTWGTPKMDLGQLDDVEDIVSTAPADGDLLMYDLSSEAWVAVPAGPEGAVFTIIGGIPTWTS